MNRRPSPFSRENQSERFMPGRGREGSPMNRDRRPGENPDKAESLLGLPRDLNPNENFPGRDPAKGTINPALANANKEGRPLFMQDKNQSRLLGDRPSFKGPKDLPLPASGRGLLGPCPEGMQRNAGAERRDQDYRDIDYRTGSGRAYDYNLPNLPGNEKERKEPRPTPPQRSNNAGSQDQDYRSASVKDKVSHTISISGIPKTATMQQILGAFALRDGVPMQGMKIKNVVPGYSFDMAYVEFLNLEDAVHFMESNQSSLKVGNTTVLMKYIHPDRSASEAKDSTRKPPQASKDSTSGHPSTQSKTTSSKQDGSRPGAPAPDPSAASKTNWQRSSDLTPEAWQQQVDKQTQQREAEMEAEAWAHRNASRHAPRDVDPIFKESRTMIMKNLKNDTSLETILKTLEPFAYLDERNVRLVRGKPPGNKCLCFVDMESHEQVKRLVDLLTRPRPLILDGVRVYAEIAKPLKNQGMFKKEFDKSNSSILGHPHDVMEPHFQPQQPPPGKGEVVLAANIDTPQSAATAIAQHAVGFSDRSGNKQQGATGGATGMGDAHHADPYIYDADTPDLSNYLYDATSGFYYDPQTTLYYDPNSRYFYNGDTQQYLYWDGESKTYIPVSASMEAEGSHPVPALPGEISVPSGLDSSSAVVTAAVSAPAATPAVVVSAPAVIMAATAVTSGTTESDAAQSGLDGVEKKEDGDAAGRADRKDKEEKPKSLAAFKIMKDMERWAKIQNRQKESVRAPSPVLKTPGGFDDHRSSKAADAAFAIFERKQVGGDDLFKKPLAPPKKEEKGSEKGSKRPMNSLGLLAADYGAGSDEEEEEKPEQASSSRAAPAEDHEDKLTDWKKMACLLCRRQFPNKDALVRHQQLSDLHKQNMEIHLKIKRSKRELEALENQEKELNATVSTASPPDTKRRRYQNQHQGSWGGGSREGRRSQGSERPGLGSEPPERRKKDTAAWDHATYKQAVRKAMFARFKELD